jgi:uncharacterized delta-60 repeat protein
VLSDGRVAYYLAGNDHNLDDEGLEQILPDGSPDGNFASGGLYATPNFVANVIAVDSQGRVIMGGDDDHNAVLIRLDTSGHRDATFGTGAGDLAGMVKDSGGNTVTGLTILPGDEVAYAREDGDFSAPTICRLAADGTPVSGFGTQGCWKSSSTNVYIYGLGSDSSGKIYAGGQWNDPNDAPWAAQIAADGSTAQEVAYPHGSGGTFYPSSAVRAGGDVAVVGYQGTSTGSVGAIAMVGPTGADAGFHQGYAQLDLGNLTEFRAAAQQSDGKIVVVGLAEATQGSAAHGVVLRYKTDGTLDPGFGSGGVLTLTDSESLNAVAIDGAGRILVGGLTNDYNAYLARIWP